MLLGSSASATVSACALVAPPSLVEELHTRRRRIDDDKRPCGLFFASSTDRRTTALATTNCSSNSSSSSSSSSILRTLYLIQSLLSLLQLSSVPMATAAPLFYCHRLDAFPRRMYATKTSYDDVRSLQDNADVKRVTWARNQTHGDSVTAMSGCIGCRLDLEPYLNASQLNGLMRCQDSSKQKAEEDGCDPVSVYLLARHGTRFNKLTNMDRMTQQLQRIQDLIKAHATQGVMCKEDLDWLSEWKPRHSVTDDSKLSTSGWSELQEIGRRYGELFPEVLRHAYSPSLFEFRYTNYTGKGDRTRQSAKAFAKGLWGEFENVEMIENTRPDWLLQFYEYCHKYLQVVGLHPVEDYEKFKTAPEMTEVIDDVNKRLGLPRGTLRFSDVYLIFENCRLEHGLYRDAPWCSVLTPAMLEVIEYHQDIKYYWEDSYGNRISYEPACTLVKDILQHLGDETKLGRFRFAHSGTLDSLYTRIGLFEDDEPLRATNFARHRSRRRWATSRSTPMAANIVFVKYRCRHPPAVRVQTLVNENTHRPVTIPGCPSSLCPLDTLTALWRPIADNCDIERICEQPLTANVDATNRATDGTRSSSASSSAAASSSDSDLDLLPVR